MSASTVNTIAAIAAHLVFLAFVARILFFPTWSRSSPCRRRRESSR